MTQNRISKKSGGTAMIEYNHSGIPIEELKLEESDKQQ